MNSKKTKEPALEKRIHFRRGADGKPDGTVTILRRGFLDGNETKRFKGHNHLATLRPDGNLELRMMATELRELLEEAGIANDTWPIMPMELDPGYVPEEHGDWPDDDLWLELAEQQTEPLTKLRIAAQKLHAINRIRASCPEELKPDVVRLMQLSGLYKLVGSINELAVAGSEAQKARAKGPQVKSQKAKGTQLLVLRLAEAFWIEHPRFKGNLGKTARSIAGRVNGARRKADPKAKRLAAKTIADHLSKALAGDKF